MDPSDGLERALLRDGDTSAGGGMWQDLITDFAKHRTIVVSRLKALREPNCTAWQEEVQAAERALQEMESTRQQVRVQMRLELSGAGGSQKQDWEARLQEWTKEANSLKTDLLAAKEEHSRKALLGTGAQAAQRASAMHSTELLQQSSQKLENVKMEALETEDISMGILSDLHSQRETILHMRANMGIVSTELSSAARTLRSLIRGAEQKKLLTYLVAFVLGLGLTCWLLSCLGLSMGKTVAVACSIVVFTLVVVVVRQRLRDRSSTSVDP
jgi:vesicle transport through interaction with t-SNAREs protein 1